MEDHSLSERLRRSREDNGETLAQIARRLGVRQESVLAIEEGRFADLPSGIYGRAAIRSCAAASGLDPDETLAALEPRLRPLEDPVDALGKLKGVRARAAAPAPAATTPAAASLLPWRRLGAAFIDALVVVSILLVSVLSVAVILSVRVAVLDSGAGYFAILGGIFAAAYFACFGGVAGATLGERATGVAVAVSPVAVLTPGLIAARAVRSATEDLRSIRRAGELLARSSLGGWRTQRA